MFGSMMGLKKYSFVEIRSKSTEEAVMLSHYFRGAGQCLASRQKICGGHWTTKRSTLKKHAALAMK
jgi:hypothetical protein